MGIAAAPSLAGDDQDDPCALRLPSAKKTQQRIVGFRLGEAMQVQSAIDRVRAARDALLELAAERSGRRGGGLRGGGRGGGGADLGDEVAGAGGGLVLDFSPAADRTLPPGFSGSTASGSSRCLDGRD